MLAQSASGYRENQEVFANDVYSFRSDLAEDDWRKEIVDYLENPSRKVSRKLRYKAIKFVLLMDVCITNHWMGCSYNAWVKNKQRG
jgi:hypothetical protein